jgi:hypothetical protein
MQVPPLKDIAGRKTIFCTPRSEHFRALTATRPGVLIHAKATARSTLCGKKPPDERRRSSVVRWAQGGRTSLDARRGTAADWPKLQHLCLGDALADHYRADAIS